MEEVPTDSVPEIELGDTAADIQWRREERVVRERKEAQKQREDEARREEVGLEETNSKEKGVAEKRPGWRKVKLKERLEERRVYHSHDTRRGTGSTST